MKNEDLYTDKTEAYYEQVRYDILSLIRPGTERLLDVGCGSGQTGLAAKTHNGVREVAGIEFVGPAAEIASKNLDTLVVGDIQQLSASTFPPGHFDCIVCADVLEHLVDPWGALEKLSLWLRDDGTLIASLPNIRHITSLAKIIFDRLEYEDYGILDRTHLRFFTLHTIREMFTRSGFKIIRVETNRSRSWKFSLLSIATLGLIYPFTIFQYRIVAVKQPKVQR